MENTESTAAHGTFYVTGTPIGNLQDISDRVRDVLSSVDLVAAEDTRRTRILVSHLGISVRLISCREHNEAASTEKIIEALRQGRDVAMVTDAGTPALSDPGRRAVRMVRSHGFRIVPIPGPSAVTVALSVSGMPSSHFFFEGFLPSRQAARRKRLEKLSSLECTIIFFEAPHRLKATLADMLQYFGNRETFLARELTKLHETLTSSSISALLDDVSRNGAKGEITLLVQGAESCSNDTPDRISEATVTILSGLLESGEFSTKDACRLLSSVTGISRNSLYSRALTILNDT